VILFGGIELRGWRDLGDDGPVEKSRSGQRLFGCARPLFLLGRDREYRRAVLLADIRPLAVHRRGIVVLPKNLEKIAVGDFRRVVRDLERFGMAGTAAADVLISGILRLTARVTDAGAGH